MYQRWIIIFLLSLLGAAAYLQLQYSRWGDKIDYIGLDLWTNVRGPLEPPPELILAAMDEVSYQDLGVPFSEAWPRALHAKLLARLAELKVRRVVFDILFLGAGADPEADKKLAGALRLVPSVLGADTILKNIRTSTGYSQIEQVLLPPKEFVEAADKTALVGFRDDSDRVRSFYRPVLPSVGHIPPLAAAAAMGPDGKVELPGKSDLIKYYGPTGTIPMMPISEILNAEPESLRPAFENKIVFVGLGLQTQTGPAQKDNYLPPFYKSSRMYGFEIHATAAGNLLHNDWIRRLEGGSTAFLLGLSAFLSAFAIFALRPGWGATVLFAATAAWAAVSYYSFLHNFFLPGLPLVGVFLPAAFLGSTLYYYLYTNRQQRQAERAFQYYLSPTMARQMRTNPAALKLGGENIFGTALFTDIANFTNITERMLPQDAANMLNRYFTEVMEVIFAKEGTLIKYIGDAAFVIWGAPLKVADHALRACQTALAIQAEGERFNASKRFPALHTRVGINSGPMLVGNLGSERRFDYTAIGDSINVAARVEGLNKYFGTPILITESVFKQVRDKVYTLLIGSIKVIGKEEHVHVYTIKADPFDSKLEKTWLEALKHFEKRRWDDAARAFESVQSEFQEFAKAAGSYLAQIKTLQTDEPDGDWRGEVVVAGK